MVYKDIIGKRFNKWIVKSFSYKDEKGHSFYLCHCDCGSDEIKRKDTLTSDVSKGCKKCSWKKLWVPIKIDDNTLLIPLTQNKYALIDNEDYEKIKDHGWHIGEGYATTNINRVPVRMHRLIMNFPFQVVDHINGDTLDNRKQNLRVCSQAQNSKNRSKSKTNKTGFKGVFFEKALKKYRARISINGQYENLGIFDRAEEASAVYTSRAKELQGSFFREEKSNTPLISSDVFKQIAINEEIQSKQAIFYEEQKIEHKRWVEQENKDEKEKTFIKGMKSGKLKAVAFSHFENDNAIWACTCDCGGEKKTAWYNISLGRTRSCGCLINKDKKKKWFPTINGKIVYIPLTGDKFALIDIDDLSKVKDYSWYLDSAGYARNRDGLMMHRIITGCPPDKEVDHRDHDRLNNRICNLRICNRSQNQANKFLSVKNTTGFKGVSYSKGKYSATISCDGKSYHLGYFSTPEQAYQVYVHKGIEMFGEFFNDGSLSKEVCFG